MAAVDRLFEDGFPGVDSSPSDAREEAVTELLGLLDSYPVESASEDLVNATLARVSREEGARADRMSIQNVPRVATRSLRLPDFFAVAAALFLAVGIGWPLYSVIQDQNQIIESTHRLRNVGDAIAGFSAENGGLLPLDRTVLGDDEDIPCPLSGNHGLHLDGLTDRGLESAFLFIENGDRRERLVAYRVPFSLGTFRLESGPHGPEEVLLSDPNPVVRAHRHGHQPVDPSVGSHLHDFRAIVVLKFGLQVETLENAVRPDGDSIWVGEDHDPDRLSHPIRPVDVHDEIVAH